MNIVDKFREFYESVYNSSESNAEMDQIKIKIRELLINSNDMGNTALEVNKLTADTVKKAACKMKPKKGDVSESYTSDAILNAPDILFELLASVFRSWLVHGTVYACMCFPAPLEKLFEKSCRCHLLQSDCWIFTSP